MKKLLVIDGNSLMNRMFYGIRPLTTHDGTHTNAVYGFVNILLKNLGELNPDMCAVAFDLPAPTFRHKSYAEYKAGRRAMPEELASQFPLIKQCIPALGLSEVTLEGWEADDILGTLAKLNSQSGGETYILTGDRDSLQLITDDVKVLLATNSETATFDRAHFTETYGVPPETFVDVKALMGDSSDNIPGVPGIGEKTALKLISSYGSLDGIYENLDEAEKTKSLTPSNIAKLRSGHDSAYMSKALAKIDSDAPLPITLSDIAVRQPDSKALTELFTKLEFTGFIKRMGLDRLEAPANETPRSELSSPKELCGLADGKYAIAYDGDTGLFAASEKNNDETKLYSCTADEFSELLPFLCGKGKTFALHDVKSWLYRFSRVEDASEFFGNVYFDTMLAAYVLNSSDSGTSPGSLSSAYLGEALPQNPDACAMASLISRLETAMTAKLTSEGSEKLFRDVELPLAHVLYKMEKRGFKVDVAGLAGYGAELSRMTDEYASAIFMLAGRTFNPNSPKQLGEVLFDELKIPAPKKTATGYSTSADILEKLRADYPIVDCVLEYRRVAKLNSTYCEGLRNAADGGGVVHTTFNQTVTATGRLSSTEPNLQNIPIRTEQGRMLRKFFIPRSPDYVLVDADYSQIELRLLAAVADDKVMTDAFVSGTDIHAVTASQVFGIPLESVTSELRKRAKAVNFGIVYGISDFSLAADIHVTKKQAGEYIANYLKKYSGVDAYLKDVVEKANRDGYVTTLFGRRRYIPELKSGKRTLRAFGERVAMNSPIQGTAADIIKLAMVETETALAESGLDARLILQVHDELLVEAKREDAPKAAEILRRCMENCVKLSVPMTVDATIGDNWYEGH